ncbi:MAG: metallophosphoesterase family protein [Solibacillus sp.]
MSIFVVSDIHGMYKQFEQILQFWDQESKLVLLGDLVDRGPQSLEVIRKAMALKATYGEQVTVCKGNHEQILLDFIRFPVDHYDYLLSAGVRETLLSFLDETPDTVKTLNSSMQQVDYIREHFADEFAFLENAKPFKVIHNVLLTHAGFHSRSANFLESTDHDFLWIRKHYQQPNQTPYVNVFGHTPTKLIHRADDVWISEDKKYIAIDGGCAYGGQLNAVLLNYQGEVLQTFCVKA